MCEGNTGIRHSCEQDDGVTSYNYVKHDGRTFAVQKITDGANNVELTTSLLKVPGGASGLLLFCLVQSVTDFSILSCRR